jgi:hypothetical protein
MQSSAKLVAQSDKLEGTLVTFGPACYKRPWLVVDYHLNMLLLVPMRIPSLTTKAVLGEMITAFNRQQWAPCQRPKGV